MEGVVGSSSMSSSTSNFQRALNLKKKLTILKFLAQSDIHPTPLNRPTIHHIHNKITFAIWKQIDSKPHLWCKEHKLLSMSICVDYSAHKFINCPRVLEEVRAHGEQCGRRVAFTFSPKQIGMSVSECFSFNKPLKQFSFILRICLCLCSECCKAGPVEYCSELMLCSCVTGLSLCCCFFF